MPIAYIHILLGKVRTLLEWADGPLSFSDGVDTPLTVMTNGSNKAWSQ